MTVTETPGGAPPQQPGGQMSDRMQALLSAAAEEQVREQRAVSSVLGDLRGQVAALSDAVRSAASDATVERLGGVVSTVVADLRTSTSLLGQRIEALSKRIDAVAADTAAPTEQAAVRLAALSADVTAQGEIVERMSQALDQLAGFPGALSALQQDVAGLHDRLTPLAELRSGVSDLGARTAHSLEALRPQIEGISAKLDAIGTVPDTERLRDAVVDALGGRLDRLEEAAARPVAGPEALKAHFGDLRAALDSQTGDRFDEVQAALGAIENRLGQVGERLGDVGDAAGGVPALAAELARLHSRVDELGAIREQVTRLGTGVAALQDDTTGTALTLGLAGLRDDIEHLTERFPELAPPPADEVAGLVSQRVADRLVETLAPRIADVVLTRVSAALVTQLGEALSPRVKADTEDVVRTLTADSERRVLAHVDEAVLALAEALLRRRRGGRTPEAALQELDKALVEQPAAAEPDPDPDPEPVELPDDEADQVEDGAADGESVEEVLDRLNTPVEDAADDAPFDAPAPSPAPVEDRPAVTSSLAPPRQAQPEAAAAAQEAEEGPEEEPEEEPAAVSDPEPVPVAKPRDAPTRKLAKAPAKAPVKKSAPPVKKATRPPTKPTAKPILERTPDVLDDDVEPVRSSPPARPRPATRPATPPTAPPAAPPAVQAPPPPVERSLPTAVPVEPQKRKPWWRPGG